MPAGRLSMAMHAVVLALGLALVPGKTETADGRPELRAPPVDFAAIVARAAPSVVGVATRRAVTAETRAAPGPLNDRSGPDPGSPAMSVGSGFFVSTEGHLVTNHHVIADAAAIEILTEDGSRRPAAIVGIDPLTDLAVLKVDPGAADRTLPARWGDSEALRPGAWTIAVGSPFGLGGTVTVGILSARQRQMGDGVYGEFLQTDAAINVGNSGGPLFDASGEVIGVTTSIFSPTGASVGIGFAVPARTAERVVSELIAAGSVRRGFIGAVSQDLDPILARAFGYGDVRGALVSDVLAGSPAAQAGLRRGDVVIAFGAEAVTNARGLSLAAADAEPGQTVPLRVLRDGAEMELSVEVGQRETGETPAARSPDQAPGDPGRLGLSLRPLPEAVRQQMGLERSGLIVHAVQARSLGAAAGLRQGDLILEAGGAPAGAPEDVVAALEAARQAARPLLLQIVRRDAALFLAIEG